MLGPSFAAVGRHIMDSGSCLRPWILYIHLKMFCCIQIGLALILERWSYRGYVAYLRTRTETSEHGDKSTQRHDLLDQNTDRLLQEWWARNLEPDLLRLFEHKFKTETSVVSISRASSSNVLVETSL